MDKIKKLGFCDGRIYGAVTLRDVERPEQNSMALHVCNEPEAVLKNRRALAAETLPLESWALAWQKHTDRYYRVTKKDCSRGAFSRDSSIAETDALYTTEPGILIGVFTADCVGILIADEEAPCLCAIHSGWRGTASAITLKTVSHLIGKGLIEPKRARAYFSPSLQFKSLEVGLEVVELIKKLDMDTEPYIKYISGEKALIDNQGLNAKMLSELGFPAENIMLSSLDTLTNEDSFSYRRNKRKREMPITGEHFTFGYIKPDLQ